jgi:hypothetical protein
MKPIPLCSRCTFHEIASWLSENSHKINEEVMMQVNLELRAIRLKEGECIVCGRRMISDSCFPNILKIFEKYKINGDIKKEFERFFGMVL